LGSAATVFKIIDSLLEKEMIFKEDDTNGAPYISRMMYFLSDGFMARIFDPFQLIHLVTVVEKYWHPSKTKILKKHAQLAPIEYFNAFLKTTHPFDLQGYIT